MLAGKDRLAGQFLSANSFVVVQIVSRDSHFGTASEMSLCILDLQILEERVSENLPGKLGGFAGAESFRKGRMGLSVGRTRSQ